MALGFMFVAKNKCHFWLLILMQSAETQHTATRMVCVIHMQEVRCSDLSQG